MSLHFVLSQSAFKSLRPCVRFFPYNERLENILDKKKVNSDTKNLLLSMLYKIENSYEDYNTVKRNTVSKEKFIEKILTIIDEECKEILVVTPGTDEGKKLE